MRRASIWHGRLAAWSLAASALIAPHLAPSAIASQVEVVLTGTAVAGAGDFNADGFPDVIVGGAESAYLLFGGPSLDAIADLTLASAEVGDGFGGSVSAAGDFNGDGFDDVIVGAAGSKLCFYPSHGRAYVFFGGPSADDSADVVLCGSFGWRQFGSSVAAAGDFNGDGYDDVIVGAWLISPGRAYIFYGGPTADGIADFFLIGEDGLNGGYGISVAGAGDVNGDGFDDVIVGDHLAGPSQEGAAYVHFGGPTILPILKFTGVGLEAYLGHRVAGAGDLNDDGFDDVIVSGHTKTTTAYSSVYFGASIPDATADRVVFGTAIAGAGDVNGDGIADLITGAEWVGVDGQAWVGRAYVHAGGVVMDMIPDVVFTGAGDGDRFGASVAGVGDFDDDGFDDVAVSAPGAGRAYLYLQAGVSVPTNLPAQISLLPPSPNPSVGVTSIRFDLVRDARVWSYVYDLNGRVIHELESGGTFSAGRHELEWDGADRNGRRASPGVYFVVLRAGGYEAVERIVRLR